MTRPTHVAVLTDSTSLLPDDALARAGVTVVPLQVVVGSTSFDDGTGEATPDGVARALRERRSVTTSQPAPATLLSAYERLAGRGFDAVVSVHLSGEVSGTVESARAAAREAPLPVVCVDTRTVGPAVGLAARAGAAEAAGGASAEQVALTVQTRAGAGSTFFYVDTLEHLRRGGRIGAASALLGTALAVKPLLGIVQGRVEPLERVRTASRALSRLADLAVDAASTLGATPVEVVVAHLAAPERAIALAAVLRERLDGQLQGQAVPVVEASAVVGAHTGPGTLAVAVSPRE